MTKLQKVLFLDDNGYKDLKKATFACFITNCTSIIPMCVIALLLTEFFKPFNGQETSWLKVWIYFGIGSAGIFLIYIANRFDYRKTYIVSYTECAQTRLDIAEHMRRLPMSVFNTKDLTDLTSNIMEDIANKEHVLSHLVPQLIATTFSITITCVLLAMYDWRMALCIFASLPIAISVVFASRYVSSKLSKRFREKKLEVSKNVQEYIEGIKVIRSCNLDVERFKLLESSLKGLMNLAIKFEVGVGVFVMGAQTILQLGIGITALVGITLFLADSITLLSLVLFLVIVVKIYAPIMPFLGLLPELFYFQGGIRRLKEIKAIGTMLGSENPINEYTIKFEDVDFTYKKGVDNAIEHMNLTIPQGSITALVGPSGSGKSTMTKLIARFWDVDKGKITIGGVDIKTVDPEHLMSYMSFVFQDVILFNDTIMANIRIGNSEATDEEVIRVSKIANCEEFINKLPNGYATILGENGATLSGGERQRISIARALLKNAPIVMLDEHTASVDAENEALIQTALLELIKDKTVVVVAHRLRTIIGVDNIVVLDKGHLVESGRSVDLLAKPDGLFSKLYNVQNKSAEWSVGKMKQANSKPNGEIMIANALSNPFVQN
ncbi:MAG: ABC transporter ATP-binding protein/permease [Christensenellaceae bacterium]|jgi:ATP-binding cassette subfamily B protein|nr:ABC transporter ATP-binding protein/permease [Christensenellaceae bacterium]